MTETPQFWTADPANSTLRFRVRHFMIANVAGFFRDFQLTVKTQGKEFTDAEIELVIQVSSLDTGVETRDNHLRSRDFFNVADYPEIRFRSTSFTPIRSDRYQLRGELTIRDQTHPIELEVEYGGRMTDAYGQERAGFSLRTRLDRDQFGLTWHVLVEGSRAVVSNSIQVQGDLQLVKESTPPPADTFVDSLRAATLTQQSQLPDLGGLRDRFPNVMVIYEPKDKVGGDFYWYDEVDGRTILIVGDSTGHGLEGSLKAMMTLTLINQIVRIHRQTDLVSIARQLHESLMGSVRNSRLPNPSMLAFDGLLLSISSETQTMEFLGAGIGLFRIRDGELEEFKPYRISVGSHLYDLSNLEVQQLRYAPGDTFFLFSDGLKDQFGGPYGKKYGVRNVRSLLLEASSDGFQEIEPTIRRAFEEWKGGTEQMDDMTVFGMQF